MGEYRLSRRTLAYAGFGLLAGTGIALPRTTVRAQDQPAPSAGEAKAFSFERLIEQTRDLSKQAYQAPPAVPDALANIPREAYDRIQFRQEALIWASSPSYRLQLFFPGGIYKNPVRINLVSDGMAKPMLMRPDMFDLAALKDPVEVAPDQGFAGFRVIYPMERPDAFTELLTFLGFSYFRALGRGTTFGASARGLAINTGLGRPEEFAAFREFWIQEPSQPGDPLTVFALLDSPSVAGAFRFDVVARENTRIAIDSSLFFRADVEQVGIAPLTGMFFFGPNDRVGVDDYRESAHSVTGLSMWTGAGEVLWRPFVNPSDLRMSVFGDENPRGFGLAQRPRAAPAYDDIESAFEKKPNAWVEPRGSWGKGSVRLIEIPTQDENNQNIVAFWTPEDPVKASKELRLSYSLIWSLPPPIGPGVASVAETRIGLARNADGSLKPNTHQVVIDYAVPPEDQMPGLKEVQAQVTAGNAGVANARIEENTIDGGWRLFFEVDSTSSDPIELRAMLKAGDRTVSETWLYRLDKS